MTHNHCRVLLLGLGLGMGAISNTETASGDSSLLTARPADLCVAPGALEARHRRSIEARPGRMQGCPPIPSGGGEDLQVFITKADASCTVENGSYVRALTLYELHVLAEAYGQCTLRGPDCSPLPCTCVTTGTQLRWPSAVGILLINSHPLSPFSVGPIYPNGVLQQWDSRVPGQASPPGRGWSTSTLGEATLRFTEFIFTTTCNILPSSKVVERTAYVLECKPEWFTGGTPPVNFHGPQTGNIKIVLPSAAFENARASAEAAAAAWAKGLGRNISVQPGYQTCESNDSLCIQLKNDHGTQPGDPVGCASLGTATYNPTTGVWAGSTSVRFEPNWTGGHPDNLTRTIAHELGHYCGLWNREHASCSSAGTIMSAGNCYSPDPPPAGTALGPTSEDVLPVMKSTYGNQVRSTCGW
jgi:hypothetical protein